MLTWLFFVLQFSSIACTIVGGVFLAFSDFIMRSLDKAGPGAGIDAMQVINREVIRSVFVTLLLVLAAASPFMIGYAFIGLAGLPQILTALGGAIYLVGVFGVTVVFNIPMNNRLDRDALHQPTACPTGRTCIFRSGLCGTMCAPRPASHLRFFTWLPVSRCSTRSSHPKSEVTPGRSPAASLCRPLFTPQI
ncbi:MAG: DUF1772 domain-containing protein [Hyphomicrobiales bacterium]|nr:DUF1772 domain-containing protein [Hyphomicrobiales bacterium]MCP4997623.1 DUF1772 domain-containing protein [Hyphomicrobiales bacterium]